MTAHGHPTTREVRVELLAGRRVRDAAGAAVGRIEEIHAERQDLECIVEEFVVGPAALLERLGAWAGGTTPFKHLGGLAKRLRWEYRIPWHLVDLSDPAHPRVRCRRAELEPYRRAGDDVSV
ncbi:MAG TPA: hypothetical protein VFS40_01040 [Gemmatimonadales bacterium]|nr:hypothetical protein [Gemmatimonadales bacterium]